MTPVGQPGSAQRVEHTLRRLAWNTLMLPRRWMDRYVRSRLLPSRIRHVHGPSVVACDDDDVLLICVVRNGALHVRDYVEHHLRLGVRHIILLDNGSTDRTLEIAAEYAGTTLLQTDVPYARYEIVMKRYLAQRFSAGKWNLCVDIDERFDYPFSTAMDLRAFVAYLNRRSFTVVLAQMLDLFASEISSEGALMPGATFRDAFPYYDLSAIEKTVYTWGSVPRPDIRMHWGGIRRTLFGSRNGLTKAALARVDPGIELFAGWHHVPGSRIADVTAVLLHYPFAGAFSAKIEDAVRTGRYGFLTTAEYRRYQKALRRTPRMQLDAGSARRFASVDTLLDDGFLVASPAYREAVFGSAHD